VAMAVAAIKTAALRSCLPKPAMAYPRDHYPVHNNGMYHHVNWTWAPPGAKGNVCENCGTHCFCADVVALLPRTRSAAAAAAAAAAPVGGIAAVVAVVAAAPVGGVAAAIAGGAAAPVGGVAAAIAGGAAAPVDGIAALFEYDSD